MVKIHNDQFSSAFPMETVKLGVKNEEWRVRGVELGARSEECKFFRKNGDFAMEYYQKNLVFYVQM